MKRSKRATPRVHLKLKEKVSNLRLQNKMTSYKQVKSRVNSFRKGEKIVRFNISVKTEDDNGGSCLKDDLGNLENGAVYPQSNIGKVRGEKGCQKCEERKGKVRFLKDLKSKMKGEIGEERGGNGEVKSYEISEEMSEKKRQMKPKIFPCRHCGKMYTTGEMAAKHEDDCSQARAFNPPETSTQANLDDTTIPDNMSQGISQELTQGGSQEASYFVAEQETKVVEESDGEEEMELSDNLLDEEEDDFGLDETGRSRDLKEMKKELVRLEKEGKDDNVVNVLVDQNGKGKNGGKGLKGGKGKRKEISPVKPVRPGKEEEIITPKSKTKKARESTSSMSSMGSIASSASTMMSKDASYSILMDGESSADQSLINDQGKKITDLEKKNFQGSWTVRELEAKRVELTVENNELKGENEKMKRREMAQSETIAELRGYLKGARDGVRELEVLVRQKELIHTNVQGGKEGEYILQLKEEIVRLQAEVGDVRRSRKEVQEKLNTSELAAGQLKTRATELGRHLATERDLTTQLKEVKERQKAEIKMLNGLLPCETKGCNAGICDRDHGSTSTRQSRSVGRNVRRRRSRSRSRSEARPNVTGGSASLNDSYRTMPCSFWYLDDKCRNGEDCRWYHEIPESMVEDEHDRILEGYRRKRGERGDGGAKRERSIEERGRESDQRRETVERRSRSVSVKRSVQGNGGGGGGQVIPALPTSRDHQTNSSQVKAMGEVRNNRGFQQAETEVIREQREQRRGTGTGGTRPGARGPYGRGRGRFTMEGTDGGPWSKPAETSTPRTSFNFPCNSRGFPIAIGNTGNFGRQVNTRYPNGMERLEDGDQWGGQRYGQEEDYQQQDGSGQGWGVNLGNVQEYDPNWIQENSNYWQNQNQRGFKRGGRGHQDNGFVKPRGPVNFQRGYQGRRGRY